MRVSYEGESSDLHPSWRLVSSIPWFCMHRGCVHVEHGSHALPTLQCPAPAIRGSSIRFVLQKEDWSELVNYPLSCHYSTVCGQVTGPWHASIGSPKSQSEIWTPLPVNLFTGIVLLHALVWPGASLINSFWLHLLHLLLVVAARWKLRSVWLWFANCFVLKSNRCFYFLFSLNVTNYNWLTCSYAWCLELKREESTDHQAHDLATCHV